MKRKWILLSACLFVLLLLPAAAFSEEGTERKVKIGVGVGSSISEYSEYSPLVLPFPMIEYDDNLFYVRGFRGGIKVLNDENNEASVFVQYDTQSFYNSRTGDSALAKLDNRYSSLFAGVSYSFKSPYGIFNVCGMTDILGISDGTIVDASYAFPFRLQEFTLVPSVGVKYADSAYNDYYYGISRSESAKSSLSEYSPVYSFSPYVGLTANIHFMENWDAGMYTRLMLLDGTVTSSPMVDKEAHFSFGAMLNYTF
ncbi:MAG: MipA/OmpV family protein [Desulfovibrio sp.]|nr:MipA/OmpV family protein [Desulfovibrio sp.]